MKKYRLLCQDIIEHTSETLSKDIAIRVMLDQLRDLGWSEGSAGNSNMSGRSTNVTVASLEEQKGPMAMLSPARGRAAAIPMDMMNDIAERVDEVEVEEPEEQVATIDSFAKQLVTVKQVMVDNRKNINTAVSEVNSLYSDMAKLISK